MTLQTNSSSQELDVNEHTSVQSLKSGGVESFSPEPKTQREQAACLQRRASVEMWEQGGVMEGGNTRL